MQAICADHAVTHKKFGLWRVGPTSLSSFLSEGNLYRPGLYLLVSLSIAEQLPREGTGDFFWQRTFRLYMWCCQGQAVQTWRR